MKRKKLITELTFKENKSTVTHLLISNQKFNTENQVTRPCVAVLAIFNTFPCSGVTGGAQLEGGALFFNPSPIVTLKIGALRTVMLFTVAVVC